MRRALIVAACGAIVACSVLTSFDGIEPHPAQVSAPDAEPDVRDVPEAGCALARWPGPPFGAVAGGDVGELTSAITRLRILDAVATGRQEGFDLDGLCTCPDRTACAGPEPGKPCDDAGVDNAAENLFRLLLSQGVALDDTGLRTGIEAGQYGIVMQLSGYNGLPDDADVTLKVFNAVGVNGDGGVPREDGQDQWTFDSDSLIDGMFPAYFSTRAYVAGGVLVADLVRLVVRARLPTGKGAWSLLELEVRSAHIVAHVGARAGAGVSLERGHIAGRMTLPSLLAQGQRSGACRDSGVYSVVKPIICAARDLPLDPAKDGRDVPCDALSMGMGFDAVPAVRAPGLGRRADVSPCDIVADECP